MQNMQSQNQGLELRNQQLEQRMNVEVLATTQAISQGLVNLQQLPRVMQAMNDTQQQLSQNISRPTRTLTAVDWGSHILLTVEKSRFRDGVLRPHRSLLLCTETLKKFWNGPWSNQERLRTHW